MAEIQGNVTPEETIEGTVFASDVNVSPSNAEVIDARKAHDGTVFESLGKAIRTQVTNLWNAVNGKQPAGDYLTKETDPTVPAWAKQPNKPSYTYSETGSAPAGFGLGVGSYSDPSTRCTTKEQLDAINGNSFFAYYNTSDFIIPSDGESQYAYGTHYQYSEKQGKQSAVCVYNGDVLERIKVEGAWRNWEYARYMCNLGVEYRLTERYQGKAVYTKLIDCGQVASGQKTVTLSLNATNLVRYSGQYVGDDGKFRLIPWLDQVNYPSHFINVGVQSNNVYICAGTAYGNTDIGKLYLQVWYTKY
jgi:hypothetical protein